MLTKCQWRFPFEVGQQANYQLVLSAENGSQKCIAEFLTGTTTVVKKKLPVGMQKKNKNLNR